MWTNEKAQKIALDFLTKNDFIDDMEDLELKEESRSEIFQNNKNWSIGFRVNNGWGEYRKWYFELTASDLSVCCVINDHGNKNYYQL